MSQPLAVFQQLIDYIDESLAGAKESSDRSEYPEASGRLIGGMMNIRQTLRLMTPDRAFDHIQDDPSTLLVERISTDVYSDALREFFDGECLETAAGLVDEDLLDDDAFREAFITLAERRWPTCPHARERMIDDARGVADARDRFMDGSGHRRDTTIVEWGNEITDESFITEVLALMAHRNREHLRQVAAWRDDPNNPANEDSEPSPQEETHVRAAS